MTKIMLTEVNNEKIMLTEVNNDKDYAHRS